MIETGKDFDEVRFNLLGYCDKLHYNYYSKGLGVSEVNSLLGGVMGLEQKPFDNSSIEQAINEGHAVLATVHTEANQNYVEPNTDIDHMVTIVGYDDTSYSGAIMGYDDSYYYCAVGDGNYTAIPKSNFDKNVNIYIKK